MTADAPKGRATRLLFIGDHSLADGFRLIGFQTVSDPEPAQVNRILRDLDRARENAFVVVDDAIMEWDVPMLAQLRREGGRIIVISLPPLASMPPRLTSDVAQRLQNLFGAGTISAGGNNVNQVLELEQAILARAKQLADQYAEQAQQTRDAVLHDAAERLRQREQREEAQARALSERHYRQRVQAAELKLQSHLDRMRWNLVRRVEDRLAERMRAFIKDEAAYLEHLRELLQAAAEQFESDNLVVQCNAEDRKRLHADWAAIEKKFPGKTLHLDEHAIETLGGVLVSSDDGRIRVNNTFEGRMARLRLRLQQAILERLLPASPESGNLFTG